MMSNASPMPSTVSPRAALEFVFLTLLSALLITFSWGPTVALGTFDLRYADGLLVLLVGAFIVRWVVDRRVPTNLLRQPLIIVLTVFALWTLTSLIVTVTPALTVRRIVRVWLLLVMVIGVVDLRPSFRSIVNLLSVHLLLQAFVAIGQAILQRDIGLHWLGEQQQMAQLGYNVLDTGSRLILRVQGLAEHPNLLAITLVVPMLIVVSFVVLHTELTWRETIFPILAVLAGLIALFFTFSRAATLGGSIAVLLLLTLRNRAGQSMRKGTIIVIGVGLLALATMLFAYRDVVLSRLNFAGSQLERTSVTERAVQNQVGWEMVQASPLVGVGAHSARARFAEFLGEETAISHTIHNTVLLISAELGLPAGILWLIVLFAPPIYAIQHRRTLSVPAIAYSVALTPYLITNFTSPASFDTPVGSLLHWLLLALWISAISES